MAPAMIVFSHLRWDFVYQRPQHLLSRLAKHYQIHFIEEPVFDTKDAWEIHKADVNVTIYRPHTTVNIPGFHDDQLPSLQRLLQSLIRSLQLKDYIVWFYTPMALPLLRSLVPRAIIYDCMDELSAFQNAPRQLLQRESALLKCADLVFTGGPSLYKAKKDRHPRVHCFPSSVDVKHFRQACDPLHEHNIQRHLPRPRLGFYGVIDERLNIELLAGLAEARSEWQIVMVGPVVKIEPASLPKHENIHYFGQQLYIDLPGFLAGWDVCLLPFAMNESTRFISPTKTLEYMVAELPIVSTPIRDVVEPYGDIVHIAEDVPNFVEACDKALRTSLEKQQQRIENMRTIVKSTSWDRTATQMHDLIQEVVAGRIGPPRQTLFELHASDDIAHYPTRTPVPTAEYGTVVVGAGPTGLSAAYHLGKDSLLLERNDTVGGWCRSIEDNSFTFDYAGHIMFSNDPYVLNLYKTLLGDNVHWQDREAWIYSQGVYTRYPFQGALYGLPPEILKECIVGAIEARFGNLKDSGASAKAPATVNSSTSACKAESITDCCADGLAESTAPLVSLPLSGRTRPEPRNFEEFIYQVWGRGVAKHFAIPYNRKLWTVPLTEMETSWLGGRVPLPDLEEMIEGALRPVPKPMGPNARFGYPLRGGFQALMDGFLPYLHGDLRLNAEVVKVVPSQNSVILNDGSTYRYQKLISTMPLPVLVKLIGNEAPPTIHQAVQALRHVSIRCVNLGIGRAHITDKHWIYYPEDSVFHRIFVQGNASPHCNPPGGFGFTCEISYSPYKPLPCDGDALIQRCIDDCIKAGFIRPDDPILAANQVDMPCAYVIYDHQRKKNVDLVRHWLAERDIILAGRYSEWEYYNSDHAFIAGKKAADQVLSLTRPKSKVSGL